MTKVTLVFVSVVGEAKVDELIFDRSTTKTAYIQLDIDVFKGIRKTIKKLSSSIMPTFFVFFLVFAFQKLIEVCNYCKKLSLKGT